MSTSKHIVSVFKQFCRESGFVVHPIGPSTFLGHFSGENGRWPIFCHLKGTRLLFSSTLPVTVPPAKRPAVMEYVTRANYGLSLGSFEMDLDDGEVGFRTSMEVADGKLTSAMVGVLLGANLITTDHYLKGLLHLLLTDATPAEIIRDLEETAEASSDADELSKLLEDVELDKVPGQGDD